MAGLLCATTWPATLIAPESAVTAPVMILMSVDLPAPFSPISACTSPGRSSNETSLSACTPANDLLIPAASSKRSDCAAVTSSNIAPVMCVRLAITLVIWAGVGCAQVRPLRNTSPPVRAAEISVTGITFQELLFGREGPDYFSAKRPPQRAAQEIALARIHGQEGIAAIRFELVDEAGQALGSVPAVRTSSGVDDGEYQLLVQVPAGAFRVRVIGQDINGKAFARLYPKVFQPGEQGPPDLPQIPGMTAGQKAGMQNMMQTARSQMSAMFVKGDRLGADPRGRRLSTQGMSPWPQPGATLSDCVSTCACALEHPACTR